MPLTEHFATFTNPREGGTTALYVAAGSLDPPVSVNGIFKDGAQAVLTGFVSDDAPMFCCALESVPDVAAGDAFTINGDDYTVRRVMPDGTGWLRLQLEDDDG